MVNLLTQYSQQADLEQKNKKIHNKGFFRASFVSGASLLPIAIAASKVPDLFQKTPEISLIQNNKIKDVIPEILKKTGLEEKGVKAVFVSPFNKNAKTNLLNSLIPLELNEIRLDFKSKIKNPKILKAYETLNNSLEKLALIIIQPSKKDKRAINLISQNLKNNNNDVVKNITNNIMQQQNITQDFAEMFADMTKNITASPALFKAKNNNISSYISYSNTILIPDNKVKSSLFKEIGHALNKNSGALTKFIRLLKPLALILPSYIALLSLLNKRKTNEDNKNPNNKLQKMNDFIKKNAGKLTFLSVLPMIAEETLAVVKGNKIAKSLLNTKKYNTVKSSNLISLAITAGAGLIAVFGVHSAVKVKDNIQNNYENKLNNK